MSDFIIHRLRAAREKHSEQDFIVLGDDVISYGDAWCDIDRFAQVALSFNAEHHFIGVLAERGTSAYLATLAAIATGGGYVSLTAKNPVDRLRKMALSAELHTVFVCDGMIDVFFDAFADFPWPITGISTTQLSDDQNRVRGAARLICAQHDDVDISNASLDDQCPDHADNPLYILFTSGSTGEPKGVPVSNKNVAAYLDFVTQRYAFGVGDRLSQTFELSFDLSVHDILCAWTTGATLVPFTGTSLMAAARVIKKYKVTCWFSVPSQAALMARLRSLKPDSFPDLRVSLFCGEALPATIAQQWSVAAPNSLVENLYGPTEATIAITHYTWNKDTSPSQCRHGLVPIGRAFDSQYAEIDDGGELLLGGTQLFQGYWKAPDITAEKIITDDNGARRYRTGDIAEVDDQGCLYFIGRMDSQIKFRGHRIELSEIEHALRTVSDTEFAVVLAWPVIDGEIKSLSAALCGSSYEASDILTRMKDILPPYMIPEQVHILDEFPTNLSGKIDRKAIIKIIESRARL